MRKQRGPALGQKVADVDEGREVVGAVLVESAFEPRGVHALLTPAEVRLVQGLDPCDRPRHVVQLERLPRCTRVGIGLRIAREVERRQADLVHANVVGVRIERAILAVRDDHLRAFGADDLHEAADRLVERCVGEVVGTGVLLGIGHAAVAVTEQLQ